MPSSAAVAQIAQDVQGDGRWLSLHNSFLHDAREKEPEVVLIGDSLIANMSQSLWWKQMFEPLHCLNFGIGGDRTQHVLWRVSNGELDQIQPKVVVLLVGTNNCDDTADQVKEGILAIVQVIHERQPSANVIVLGLLPKGELPNIQRDKNADVNKLLAEELKDKPQTIFLKIDDSEFVNSNGIITRDIMYDFLHLTADIGYQKLCEPLFDEIQNQLGTFIKVGSTSYETSSMAGDLAGN